MRIVPLADMQSVVTTPAAIEAVRAGFIAHARGQVNCPEPVQIVFRDDQQELTGECHVKSAVWSGRPYLAVKIASGSYRNAARGLPGAGGMIILISADHRPSGGPSPRRLLAHQCPHRRCRGLGGRSETGVERRDAWCDRHRDPGGDAGHHDRFASGAGIGVRLGTFRREGGHPLREAGGWRPGGHRDGFSPRCVPFERRSGHHHTCDEADRSAGRRSRDAPHRCRRSRHSGEDGAGSAHSGKGPHHRHRRPSGVSCTTVISAQR